MCWIIYIIRYIYTIVEDSRPWKSFLSCSLQNSVRLGSKSIQLHKPDWSALQASMTASQRQRGPNPRCLIGRNSPQKGNGDPSLEMLRMPSPYIFIFFLFIFFFIIIFFLPIFFCFCFYFCCEREATSNYPTYSKGKSSSWKPGYIQTSTQIPRQTHAL